jgi:DNA-binding transcriptional regulator LsrR (DeoR family)
MSDGRRARADQVAERVNIAAGLLSGGMTVSDATAELAGRLGVSDRQARRYVERARDEGVMEVAGPKVVFTVKLPAVLVERVRRAARATGESISALVSQALAEFLDRRDRG